MSRGVPVVLAIAASIAFGLAPASAQVRLVVYSSHAPAFLGDVKAKFEARHPEVEIENVQASTLILHARIRAERRSPRADIIYGGDAGTYVQMKAEGLLQPTRISVDEMLVESAKDREGYWRAPYILPGIFLYNTRLISEKDAPKDWNDLLDSRWKGKLAMRNPLQSGTAKSIYGSLVYVWGEKRAFEYFRQIHQQVGGTYLDDTLSIGEKVATGKVPLTVWLEFRVMEERREKGYPLGIIYPASGTYAAPEPIGIVAGSQQPEWARRYIEFVLTKEMLIYTAERYFKRPARKDISLAQLPRWILEVAFLGQTTPRIFPIDWEEFGRKAPAWLKRWEREIYRK
jgi:iron(III) transport system substrate-binding protein